MRRLLAHRDARIYIAVQSLSVIGDSALWLAMGIWVKILTGSNSAAGLTFFAFVCGALAAPAASRPLLELMKFETLRAAGLLDAGAPLVGTLRGTARLAVGGYVAGGRAALAAITAARYDVLARPAVPGKRTLAAQLLRTVVTGR